MSNWELYRLLCRIIGGLDDTALGAVIHRDAFPRLVALAGEYDLEPALAVRLNEQATLIPGIPVQLHDQLQQALQANTQHKLQMIAQAIKVARVLNSVGIEPVFLKGTALLLGESPLAVGFRKQVDIDLLVAPENIAAACEALTADGYFFYDFDRTEPEPFADTPTALELSAHHHHLPPLGKQGYGTLLELHKQPVRRRFQTQLSVARLLDTAILTQSHGAKFLLPAPAFQLMHLALGTFLNDSYAARFDFPLRAGQDYLEIISRGTPVSITQLPALSGSRFGHAMQLFEQLVVELMAPHCSTRLYPACDIRNRLRIMEQRFNSRSIGRLLDLQARWRYLGLSLWYDSGKLPAYLNRMLQDRKPGKTTVIGEP